MTSPGAGSICYGWFQDLIDPTFTLTMSGWDYTGWVAQLFNGPTVATSVYKGDLTPANPTYTQAASPHYQWWVKMISTGAGDVTITRS